MDFSATISSFSVQLTENFLGRLVFIYQVVKVGKFQKQIILFSFPQKTERNYFLISALRI